MKLYVSTIIERDNKFLLVKEAKKQWYEKWSFPSGHIEENEYIFDAAVREVKEETNLDVELNGIIAIYNNYYEESFGISFIFCSTLKSNNEAAVDKNEILECKWFTFEEIKDMADSLRDKDYTIDSIKKYNAKQIMPLETIVTR